MYEETKKVIQTIASIQIEALTNILNNMGSVDHDLLRTLLQIQDDELIEATKTHIQIYKDIEQYPQLIKTLNEYQLYVCSHILFKIESDLIVNHSLGVMELWSILQKHISKFHPELTLII